MAYKPLALVVKNANEGQKNLKKTNEMSECC